MLRALQWTRRRLLWLLLGTYAAGALAPSCGMRLRALDLGAVTGPLAGDIALPLPMLMVAFLLFATGYGARFDEIVLVARRPALLLAGLLANEVYPVTFIALVALPLVAGTHNDDAQNVLVGLAMVGSMPIAGASAAWSQQTGGNLALSLGLVWGSTLLSPIFTPLALHAIGFLTSGDYSHELHAVARHGARAFLLWAVIVPSLLGVLSRMIARGVREATLRCLALLSLVDLLLLNYLNASASLPQLRVHPEVNFIALSGVITIAMCAGAFVTGWWIPRRLRASRDEQTALMFGLGMNNNGVGLVLAQVALPGQPRVLLSILAYNVVQQIAAGVVSRRRVHAAA